VILLVPATLAKGDSQRIDPWPALCWSAVDGARQRPHDWMRFAMRFADRGTPMLTSIPLDTAAERLPEAKSPREAPGRFVESYEAATMGAVSASWQTDDARPVLRSTTSSKPSLEGIRVLAVDDDDDARDLLRTILESRRATVFVASNAREAFDLLAKEQPHVLVSDIAMPDEDGYALIRRIRTLAGPAGRTAAIAVTAYTGPADRARALKSGFDRHVPKPVDLDLLVRTILDLAVEDPPTSAER
jgi:CheY-like chemotaxis protein